MKIKTFEVANYDKCKAEIAGKKEEIQMIKASLGHHGSLPSEERLARIVKFEEIWRSNEVSGLTPRLFRLKAQDRLVSDRLFDIEVCMHNVSNKTSKPEGKVEKPEKYPDWKR